MIRILAIIAAVIAVPLAGVLVFAATKPDEFRVARTESIKAPPERIFALVSDLRRHRDWSPFEKKDPEMKRVYSGATQGTGAAYAWDGNSEIGQGRMEITETAPPSRITMQLDFVRPFEAHNVVDFTMESDGEATNVTWAMRGKAPYFAKVVHVFFDMDSMVGGEFETGLANLKAIAER